MRHKEDVLVAHRFVTGADRVTQKKHGLAVSDNVSAEVFKVLTVWHWDTNHRPQKRGERPCVTEAA